MCPRLLPLALSLFALLAAGCPRPCAPGGGEPTLEIGTGEEGYEPLGAEPELEIVHGPQGGYHVVIALQATHLDASELMGGHFTGTIDSEVVGQTNPWIQMRCNRDTPALQSWNNFLIWDAEPAELHGETARIDVRVVDVHGTEVSDTIEALLFDPLLED